MSFGCRLPKCTSHDLIYVDLRKLMAMPIARRFVASGLPIAGRFAASGLPVARCFVALGLPVAGRFAAFGLPIAQRANRARAKEEKWHWFFRSFEFCHGNYMRAKPKKKM